MAKGVYVAVDVLEEDEIAGVSRPDVCVDREGAVCTASDVVGQQSLQPRL